MTFLVEFLFFLSRLSLFLSSIFLFFSLTHSLKQLIIVFSSLLLLVSIASLFFPYSEFPSRFKEEELRKLEATEGDEMSLNDGRRTRHA